MLNLRETQVTQIADIDVRKCGDTFVRDDEDNVYNLEDISLETCSISKGDYLVVSPDGSVLSNKKVIVEGYLKELGIQYD